MTAGAYLDLALFALAMVLVCLGMAIAVRRGYRDLAIRRRSAREARLRPKLLRALSDDEPDFSDLDAVAGPEAKVLESLVWSMLTKVRGASRDALVAWLDARGAVEIERVRTHRRSAITRSRAAEHLGAAGLTRTSPDVARMLDDRNPEVRIVAARALGKLGDPLVVPLLLAALSGPRPVPAGIVSMALLHLGSAATEKLIEGFESSSPVMRGVCVDLVGMHGDISAAPRLGWLAEMDPSLDVRVRAVVALGRIGVPHSIEVVIRALSPQRPAQLRVAAAGALGFIGGRHALASLQTALNDDHEGLGLAAADALARLGVQGTKVLGIAAGQDGAHGQHRARHWLALSQLEAGGRRHRRRDTDGYATQGGAA